jgi:hypothetical protein
MERKAAQSSSIREERKGANLRLIKKIIKVATVNETVSIATGKLPNGGILFGGKINHKNTLRHKEPPTPAKTYLHSLIISFSKYLRLPIIT